MEHLHSFVAVQNRPRADYTWIISKWLHRPELEKTVVPVFFSCIVMPVRCKIPTILPVFTLVRFSPLPPEQGQGRFHQASTDAWVYEHILERCSPQHKTFGLVCGVQLGHVLSCLFIPH